MIYTKDEASEKWCPHVRIRDYNIPADDNRGISTTNCCIADRCSAWRWYDFATDNADIPLPNRRGYCGLAGDIPFGEERKGYCGLAGRPE